MEARESFKKRSAVSAVTEMTLINNRFWGMMRMGWRERPFELAIKMSSVTFKGQVSMKQSGPMPESWCHRGNAWGRKWMHCFLGPGDLCASWRLS